MNIEAWAARPLQKRLNGLCKEDADEARWRDVAALLNLPVVCVHAPGAAAACFVPELFTPTPETRGVIVLNMVCSPGQRARAIRHEIGHFFLWPGEVNVLFGRRFPLDRTTEAALLRERIVQRTQAQKCILWKPDRVSA